MNNPHLRSLSKNERFNDRFSKTFAVFKGNIFPAVLILICLSIFSIQVEAQVKNSVASPNVAPGGQKPGPPGPVTGSSTVTQGTATTYTVAAASGATSYGWSLSVSSAGTISATASTAIITWSSTFSGSVTISCSAINAYGTTAATAKTVTITGGSISPPLSTAYSPVDKYVSVNELTGTANVVIPIYTMKAAHADFPINLVYSATGIKATDVEGNAGVGWNVTLGGAVTRQLRGLPDDMTKDNQGSTYTGWLYNTTGTAITAFNIQNISNTSTCAQQAADINYMSNNFPYSSEDDNPPDLDTEPDIFSVNAPGLSCQLVFDSNHQIRTIPYQDLKVSYTTNAYQITSFTITNDQGITYTFAATETTNETLTTSSHAYFYNPAATNGMTFYSAWDLTSITDIHNNSINITYTSGTSIPFSNPARVSTGGGDGTAVLQYTLTGTIIPNLVSQIFCSPNNEVFSFTYIKTPSSDKSCLSTIIGMGHDVNLGYVTNTSTNGSYQRLFLNSIIDQDCTQTTNNYTPLNLIFQYDDTSGGNTNLGSPSSNDLDYWGYSNASTPTNATLLPTIEVNPSTAGYERYRLQQSTTLPTSVYVYSLSSGANRLANSYAMAGTLSQINYADGGYTTLSYALNDYYDGTLGALVGGIGAVVQGGGIRVTQILDHDGISTDADNIRTYSYTDQATGLSSGKAISLPEFAFTTAYSGTNTGSALWKSSTIISPYDLSTEDHTILYSSVKETHTGAGSAIYSYAVPATNWDSSAPASPTWSPTGLPSWSPTNVESGTTNCSSIGVLRNDVNTYPFPPNTNYDFERGQLTQAAYYNASGTEVSETDYTYQTPQVPVDITALKYAGNPFSAATATSYAKYTIHTSAGPVTAKVVNKTFDLTNVQPGSQSAVAQLVTTNYSYNDAEYKLTQQSTMNSDGSIYTTNIKYTKDYAFSMPVDDYSESIGSLVNANVNAPVEIYKQVTPAGNNPTVTTSAFLTLYGGFAGLTNNLTAPVKRLNFVSSTGVSDFKPSTVTDNNPFSYDKRYIVTENDLAYDNTGFVLSKDDGFNHIQTVIPNSLSNLSRAVISNAKYNEVAIDALTQNNGYDFVSTGGPVYESESIGRTAPTLSLELPAGTTMTHNLTQNPNAANYVFSAWVYSSQTGQLNVTISNGTGSTQSGTINYDVTTANPTKYPTGWEYCVIKIPVSSLQPGGPITISFSSTQEVYLDDVLSYPDVADITTYTYDINNYKTSETDANGVSTYYTNDQFGRLLYVYDQDKNIIERKSYLNVAPLSGVSFTYSLGTATHQVSFQVSSTFNSCIFNGGTTYTWAFGDGNTVTTTTASTTHGYPSQDTSANYTVTLTVNSPYISTQTSSTTVNIPSGY